MSEERACPTCRFYGVCSDIDCSEPGFLGWEQGEIHRCADCRFFATLMPDGVAPGECRRYPPSAWDGPGSIGEWVMVRPGTWCGEWEERQG